MSSCSLNIGVISSYGMPESITIAISEFNERTMQTNIVVNNLVQRNCSAFITHHASSNTDQKMSTMAAFNIGQEYGSTLNIPVVLSTFSSNIAMITNPIFNAFDVLQISQSSTAIVLNQYDAFFRTIPSDDIQAKAAIHLCMYFGWEEIAVIHTMDTYGIGFVQSLVSYAVKNSINVQTFGFVYDADVTVKNAFTALKKSRRYIIFHVGWVGDLLVYNKRVKDFNLDVFPYFSVYIEMDMFSRYSTSIQDMQIGSIGTCVWSPSIIESFSEIEEQYPMNETLKYYMKYSAKVTGNTTAYDLYGHDNANALLIAIDKYIDRYASDHFIDFSFNASNNESLSLFSERFIDILKTEISFIGLTGNVTFDENGDRKNGLFSYCNIDENGTMNYVGYSESDSAFIPDQALAGIHWPKSFRDQGVIPQWEYVEYHGISDPLVYVVWSMMAVSICISIFYIISLFVHRKRRIITSSHWKLSIVMCIGCCVSFIMASVTGLDENNIIDHHSSKWSFICNIRIFLICFAFLLTFGPLFIKVHRIRKKFSYGKNAVNMPMVESDAKSIMLLLLWMVFDTVIICIIFYGFDFAMDREYIKGETNIAREMWGVCQSPNDMHSSLPWMLIIFILLPKLFFVLYLMAISTMVYNAVSLMRFNEGLQLLSAAVMASVLIIIASLVLSLQTSDSQATVDFTFAFFSFIVLAIAHFCMGFMVLPRLLAIWRNDEKEFMKTIMKIEKKTMLHIQQFQSVINIPSTENTVNSL